MKSRQLADRAAVKPPGLLLVCLYRNLCRRGLFFLVSDIVLILNTFGAETKQSLRVTNISLYYIGQLLIALSLRFLA